MKLLSLYTWMAGSKSDLYGNNEEILKDQINSFWNELERISIFLVIILFIVAIVFACYYYGRYNNKPGRHYERNKWIWFGVISVIATGIFTFGTEFIFAKPKINGTCVIELKIALCNALYAAIIYLIASFLWCNFGKTNAYRLLKI